MIQLINGRCGQRSFMMLKSITIFLYKNIEAQISCSKMSFWKIEFLGKLSILKYGFKSHSLDIQSYIWLGLG